jgi:peptide/nickel transport system ATP-binding protein/oligopeptide transport system ATP-binding protein
MDETPLLKLVDVTKYFPIQAGVFRKTVGHVKAVDGVSLSLKKGEVHAVVGESGSGKSTLGRAAIRLIDPTSGMIEFKGIQIQNLSARELKPYRKNLQMIFQDPYSSLNPRLSILDAIGEGLLFHHLVKTENEKKERVAFILKEVGLSPDVMDRYPHQFSGGQQQRICIGRAIGLQPELIVCDEAVSALDVSIQAQILNLLIRLQREFKLSYLFISHDLSVVRHVSDWITVMYLGKVMETGSVKDIFEQPKHPYTQALLSSVPKMDPHAKTDRMILKGEIPSSANPPSGCPFRTRCPYAQAICSTPPPCKHGKGKGHKYFCILD